MTTTSYARKIDVLFSKMFAIRPRIRTANRKAVDEYLDTVWRGVCDLTASFSRIYESDDLQERFQSYVETEEQRLIEKLETIRYDVDAIDTLSLIIGSGRIEKVGLSDQWRVPSPITHWQNVMPLLYLLLKRDFEIFRICCSKDIHPDELWDSADTIVWTFDAIWLRHNDLEGRRRTPPNSTVLT